MNKLEKLKITVKHKNRIENMIKRNTRTKPKNTRKNMTVKPKSQKENILTNVNLRINIMARV